MCCLLRMGQTKWPYSLYSFRRDRTLFPCIYTEGAWIIYVSLYGTLFDRLHVLLTEASMYVILECLIRVSLYYLLVWIFWSCTCMVLNMQRILSNLYFWFECMVACICTSIFDCNVRECERKYSNMTMFVLPLTKGPRCFIEQETLLSLLSTGWFQGRIRAWFT